MTTPTHSGEHEPPCKWCGCVGYHAEVCEGFAVNDPARRGETKHPLTAIIGATTERIFEQAGGFDYIDRLALALDAQWKDQKIGAVILSRLELAWLLDGYARARLAADESGSEVRS